MYAYLYVCINVFMYLYMYVYLFVCMSVHKMHVCMQVYISVQGKSGHSRPRCSVCVYCLGEEDARRDIEWDPAVVLAGIEPGHYSHAAAQWRSKTLAAARDMYVYLSVVQYDEVYVSLNMNI